MDKKRFGKRLKMARVELDLTQKQLADKIKATQPDISDYEKGKILPTLGRLEKLMEILNKPVEYFFNEGGIK